jgi:hypothetical protein
VSAEPYVTGDVFLGFATRPRVRAVMPDPLHHSRSAPLAWAVGAAQDEGQFVQVHLAVPRTLGGILSAGGVAALRHPLEDTDAAVRDLERYHLSRLGDFTLRSGNPLHC